MVNAEEEEVFEVSPMPKGCDTILHYFVYSTSPSQPMSILTTDLEDIAVVTGTDYDYLVDMINKDLYQPYLRGTRRAGKIRIPHNRVKAAKYVIEQIELSDGVHKEYFPAP